MRELLVRTEDRGCGQSFAGDVIHDAPAGWKWGRKQLLPPYRVIVVADAGPNTFISMLEPLHAPGGIIAKRAAYFDLSLIGDNPTVADLMAAKRTRRSAGVIG